MDVYEFRERAASGVDAETEELAHQVILAILEVHRLIKPGLPERVYREALCHELDLRAIAYQREFPVPIDYKGKRVGQGYVDILVANRLVIELKAVDALTEVHRAQVIAYLQALDLQLGLLVNFNLHRIGNGIKRVINTFNTRA